MLLAAIAADEAGDSAKRDEFQADIDREVSKLKGNMDVDKHANTEGLEDDKASQLQAQLEASEKRISELQELLDESLTKNAEMEKNSVAHAEHSAQAASLAETHSQELDILQNRLKEAETKYEGLMAHSSKELEEAKQSAAEFGESKAAELLEEQKAVHIATLEKLEAELAAERSSAAELSTQIEALRADISAKMEELEAAKKLVESEKQAAIEAHQEKLAQLEGELRGQDTVMKSLKDEVQLLKDKKDRELVEAQESTSQTVAALEEKIASLQEKLAQTESENSSNSELLGNKESEIERLNEVINELQEKIQKIHESHSDAEQEKITELNMAHERMIAAMKAEHDSALANLAAKDGLKYVELAKEGQEMKLTLEEKIATLTEDHQATQAQLASTTAELEAIKTLSAQEMIELKSAHGDELQSLQTKLSEAEQALHDVKKLTEESNAAEKEVTANIILSLEEKLKAMEAEIIDSNTRVQSLIADLDAERAQAEALQKGLEELKGHSKDKEESQESLINKLTTETEAVTKSLEEKANELSAAEEKHTAALNDLSATHQAALEALKTEVSQAHQSALEEIQQKLDDVSSNKVELETTYATQLEALKSEHALAIEEHEAKLAALEDSHKAAIENLKQEFEESRAQHGQEVEATQRKKLDELEATHAKAIEELLGAHEEKLNNLRADLERAAEGNIAAVKDSHAADLTALQQELTKAQQAAADTTAVDKLHEELAEVSSQLANAKQEKANLESALQLSQAELSELENMRTELESTKQQLSSTNEKLTKLQQTHEGVAAELEKLKVTAAVAEEKAQEAEAKLLDLEKSIGALSEKNISLIEQLQEAEATAAKANRRIRELEFDLAEATKGKDEPTPVSNGNHPNSKGGLSESKWAVRDDDEAANDGKNDLFSHHVGADGDPVSAEDKNLGSVIQGTVGMPRFLSLCFFMPRFYCFWSPSSLACRFPSFHFATFINWLFFLSIDGQHEGTA